MKRFAFLFITLIALMGVKVVANTSPPEQEKDVSKVKYSPNMNAVEMPTYQADFDFGVAPNQSPHLEYVDYTSPPGVYQCAKNINFKNQSGNITSVRGGIFNSNDKFRYRYSLLLT